MLSKTQKDVLFSSHVGSPGGAEYALLSLASNVDGASVLLFEKEGELVDLLVTRGVPVHVCELPKGIRSIKKEDGLVKILLLLPAIFCTLVKTVLKCRKSAVLVPMSQKSFIMLSVAKLLLRKPLIWYMNDLLTLDGFNPFLIKTMVRLANVSANHVVLNSQASLDSWLHFGGRPDTACISYSGVDADRFEAIDTNKVNAIKQELFTDDKPLVAVVGRITPWKGQHIFLQALAKLPQVNAVIVGDALFGETEYFNRLKQFVQDNGLSERVVFAGHRQDIPEILAASDLFVHCSTEPEPFGRVIVEALLAGTPVIASDAGGPKEIISQGVTGILTPQGTLIVSR